jgi:hypothetical protein
MTSFEETVTYEQHHDRVPFLVAVGNLEKAGLAAIESVPLGHGARLTVRLEVERYEREENTDG